MNSSQHYLLATFVVYLLILFVIGWTTKFGQYGAHFCDHYCTAGHEI